MLKTTNAGLMLVHRLRRWPNSNPTLVQRFVFAGYTSENGIVTEMPKRECISDGT